MKKFLLLLFICSTILSAQQFEYVDGIPRDTSFNVKSTEIKVKQSYPDVVLVKSETPENVTLHENIVYSKSGKRELHLDLFQPREKGNKKFAAVLIIHGGGWRSGERKMEWPTAQHLAAKGIVAITVEYRLSPEEKYPAGIYDLKNAVRWIRANADKYFIDTNKIAAYGCSAGGELAAFLGTTGTQSKFDGENNFKNISARVNAVIDVDGILDFTHPAESNKDDDPAKPSAGKAWFGVSYKDDPFSWIEASPMNYVDENTPPFCFINSSNDRYHAGRDYVIEKMNHYEIYSEVHTITDTPHPFWLFHPWFDEMFDYMINFLSKVFNN
jgi:pectinesterase